MRSRPRVAAAVVAALGVIVLSSQACARPGSPRGGIPDRRPPVVISTEPAAKAQVTDSSAQIRFHFNERISERPARGTLDDAVLVSPATGAVHVQKGRDWIGVRVDGGLKGGTVYRVTLLPVISDLFSNTMKNPFEIVFSTGGRMIENAYAGQALDRITGRPMPDLTVDLLPRAPQPDTLLYMARTDDNGLFFFRYVAPGVYNLVAFQDRDRNRLPGPREASGERPVRVEERPDTLLVDVAVLEPDSTAATVVRAEVLDSVTLRVLLTDYLDPQYAPDARVALTAPEGHVAPPVTAVLHPAAYQALKDTAKARAAAQAGGALAAPGQERGGLPKGLPLPSQELIAQLGAPLETDVEYRVTVSGLVNINLIPNGSGDTTIVRKPPPAPRPGPAPPGGPPVPGGPPAGGAPGAAPVAQPPSVPRPDSSAVRPDTVQVALRRRF